TFTDSRDGHPTRIRADAIFVRSAAPHRAVLRDCDRLGVMGALVSGSRRLGEGLLDPAQPGSGEGHESYPHVLAGGALGEPPDETFVKGADDGSPGVVRVDVERAVVDVDSDGVVASGRRRRVEGE